MNAIGSFLTRQVFILVDEKNTRRCFFFMFLKRSAYLIFFKLYFKFRFEETNEGSTSCNDKLGQICIGGIARVMTVVKKLRQERENEKKNPIFLNIGDNFVGTLWYEMFGWNVTTQFLNIVPANATTLGNHDFDRGVPEVVHFLENLLSPIVVSNLDDTDEVGMQGKYKKSITLEINNRKVGLIGALVVATLEISNPGNLHILDEIESVKKEANRLKTEEDVNIIIVLSHCGLVIDREMAQKSDDLIDVIVGGHSHTLLYSGNQVPGPDNAADSYPIVYDSEVGHKTLIVQASAYTKYLGDLTVYFDDDGEVNSWEGNPIYLDSTIQPDPEILTAMKPWKDAVDLVAKREIGEIKSILYRNDCAFGECNIGDFFTDAFVDFTINFLRYDDGWTYACIAITNGGGIRTSLPAGQVVFDDLFTTLPFSNTIDTFELRGDDILEMLEFSASAYRNYNFLQFSGMRVVFNITNPLNERVISVTVLCRECEVPRYENLDLQKWYRVISPSFIGAGGNGFYMMKNRRNHIKGEKTDIEIAEKYLKKMSPVIQKKDNRIVILT